MSKLAGLKGAQGWTVAGIAAVAIAAAAAWWGGAFDRETPGPETVAQVPGAGEGAASTEAEAEARVAPEPAPEATPEPAAAAPEPVAQPEPEPQPTPEVPAANVPEGPRFDLVRVAPDGSTTVAGRGAPGAEIVIELDGEELGRMRAGSDGSFAGFVTVTPSDKARVMRLAQDTGAGRQVSEDEAILAPVRMAAADASAPEPDAETQAAAPAGAGTPAPAEPEPATEAMADAAEPEPAEDAPGAAEEAAQETVVLLQDAEGVRVMQPPRAAGAAPEVGSAVAIDAITYSDAGEVEIAGRGRGEGFVRIYLDNSPITTSRIAPDGNWRTGLPEVDTGVYTLRVDQVDAEGRVVSRVETPFKREAPQVVAQAGPITAVTVQPGDTLWAISRENYGEGLLYVRLFEANRERIRDPDLIYPGQVFDIPQE